MSDNISITDIEKLIKKKCQGCRGRDALEGYSRCQICRESQRISAQKKKQMKKMCKWILQNDNNCTYKLKGTNYCGTHSMYENVIDPSEIKTLPKCSSCRNHFRCTDVDNEGNLYKTCRNCRKRGEENRIIQKETHPKCLHCKIHNATDNGYCVKHWNIWWKLSIENQGLRVCPNYIRGCKTKLNIDNDYNYCENCLEEERTKSNNIAYYYRVYKKNANSRNLNFNLTIKEFKEICQNKCFYCGYQPIGTYNGIDRINSDLHYTLDNCISCCRICNIMKNDKNKDDFIKICIHIAKVNNLIENNIQLYNDLFRFPKNIIYNSYRLAAINRNYTFNLTLEQFETLKLGSCYYCGSVPNITNSETCGIDRKINHIGYEINNCVSCCSTCNIMKSILNDNEFIEHIGKIVSTQTNILNNLTITIKVDDKINETIKNTTDKEIIKKILVNKITNNNFELEPSNEKFKYSMDYYKEKLFIGNINDIERIDIKLEVVENYEQNDLWNYYRANISSFRKDKYKSVGRNIRILVKDNYTNKYLGIIAIGSDFMNLTARDEYIGWNKDNFDKLKFDKRLLQKLININTCVPNNLFGFNFCGGKLLTMLCFSKELIDIYYKKYNDIPLFITTLSLYGKSIQYDRLKELKLLGYTSGTGMPNIPDNIYMKGRELIDKEELQKLDNQSNSKQRVYGKILEILNLSKDTYLYNHIERGIYGGYLFSESKEILLGKENTIDETNINSLKDINTIFSDWLNKYAKKRYLHLLNQRKLLRTANFVTSKQYTFNEKQKKYREEKKKEEGEEYYKKQAEYMKKYRNSKKISTSIQINKTDENIDTRRSERKYVTGTITLTNNNETKDLNNQINTNIDNNKNVIGTITISNNNKEKSKRKSSKKGNKISITKSTNHNKKNIELYKKILLQSFNATNSIKIHNDLKKNNINTSIDIIQYCRRNFKKFVVKNIDKSLDEIYKLCNEYYGFYIPKDIIHEIIKSYK
jgi:hypothetical protein